jgi:hypothetical protein
VAGLDKTQDVGGRPRTIVPVSGFDAEGSDYDYETAKAAGMKPSFDPESGLERWHSRDPRTGMLLKGRTHPTFAKGVAVDENLGYRLSKRAGRYYTTLD